MPKVRRDANHLVDVTVSQERDLDALKLCPRQPIRLDCVLREAVRPHWATLGALRELLHQPGDRVTLADETDRLMVGRFDEKTAIIQLRAEGVRGVDFHVMARQKTGPRG